MFLEDFDSKDIRDFIYIFFSTPKKKGKEKS